MQLTFDLSSKDECERVVAVIGATHDLIGATHDLIGDTPAVEQAGNEPAADEADNASPTAPLEATAGVELDANGTPWNAEVHAGSKTKTAKGVWKAKRGVDKTVVAQVEAQDRARIAGTPQPVVVTDPIVEPEEMPQPTVTMEALVTKWNEGVAAGVVTNEAAIATYNGLGVQPQELANNETARRTVYDHVEGLLNPAPASVASGMPGMPA